MLTREVELIQKIDRLKDVRARLLPCLPPVWARTGHQQTVLGYLLPSPSLVELGEPFDVTLESEEERIRTRYMKGRTKTVVYLFHGLGGSSDATYMHRTALIARALGHHVFLNNHRGCGEGVGLAVEPYHSGRSEDLAAVIEFGRKKLPGHRHIAVGFSLSANALLLLVAGVRAHNPLNGAIAVNGPIQLESASKRLNQGLNLIYNFKFMQELKVSVRERQNSGRMPTQYSMTGVRTVRDLDRVYTAPAGGFASREDYYRTCSAAQYLDRIEIPTVLLSAEDDPFVDPESYRHAHLSDSTILHMEKNGGHMGYLTKRKTPLGTMRWLDYALREYINALA